MDELDPVRESLRSPKRYVVAHCVCNRSGCVHPGAELNRRCRIRTTHWMPDFSWGACDKCVSMFADRGIFVRSGKNCPSCQGLGEIGGIECRGCEGLGVRQIGALRWSSSRTSKPDGTQKDRVDELDPIRESLRSLKWYMAARCVCSHSKCVHLGAELNRRCRSRPTHWVPDFLWGACDKCASTFANEGISFFARRGKNCPSCQGIGGIGGVECRGCGGLGVRQIGTSKPDGTQGM